MDLQDYVDQAAATDDLGSDEKAIRIALFGIAGEAGEVVSEAKKFFRAGDPLPGLEDRVSEELGDLLWYMALLARRLGLDLGEIAQQNLDKTGVLWASTMPPLPDYDDHPHDRQKLPRRMTIEFVEDRSGEIPVVRMMPQGELSERFDYERDRERKLDQLGDPLDDNAAIDDGYRYHDIIHLGHAAVLGWSPVLRALMGAKRKDVGDCDRVEDGARAIATEEGLTAFVFNYFEQFDFEPDAFGGLIRLSRQFPAHQICSSLCDHMNHAANLSTGHATVRACKRQVTNDLTDSLRHLGYVAPAVLG